MTKAVVIGGGIGGLTAAISLRRAGVEAAVFESAPELREVGAGIALWANAAKALRKLGLYEAVRDRAAEICSVRDAGFRLMPAGVMMGRLDPIVGYEI